jgi:LuxR family maltose regulon positive regulatory protein
LHAPWPPVSSSQTDSMTDPIFALKSTPPRIPRTSIALPRHLRLWDSLCDYASVLLEAPSGFGKTTLLVQWRRQWLQRGAAVAWTTLDTADNPLRFVQALLHALRVATGRGVFDRLAMQLASQTGRALDALTGLLSAIAELAAPVALMLDDAERLPAATAESALAYLLVNAPPNLRIVIGSRTALPITTTDMLAKGTLTVLTAKELSLRQDESIAILTHRFGTTLSIDEQVRLHEVTGGWPIALQLAASAIEREPNLRDAVHALSARQGPIERFFLESLLANLPVAVCDFLTRIAILDSIAPALCQAVTGSDEAAAYIEQLMGQTPILSASETREWIRIHPLARDFLLSRFERLPEPEQVQLHRRAAEWFVAHEQFHEAGRHALAAGDAAAAQAYAVRALWGLARMGKLAEAREWLDRTLRPDWASDVNLQLVAAWIMTLGDRCEEGLQMAERLRQSSKIDKRTRFIASLVAAAAGGFTDRPGLLVEYTQHYPTLPGEADEPLYCIAHTNVGAWLALLRGEHQEVRQIVAGVQGIPGDPTIRLALAYGRLAVALSHLQDGDAERAAETVTPALLEAEGRAGRRSAEASMYAAVLAAVEFERDRLDLAESLLANRLDVIERTALPDAILHAYRTLARIAFARGDERRAVARLEDLGTIAGARQLPRLAAACIAEQILIHSRGCRLETASRLLDELKGLHTQFESAANVPLQPQFELELALSQARVALARSDPEGAMEPLDRADALAARLHRGREVIVVKVLRAQCAERQRDGTGVALLREAVSLAAIGGLVRVIADADPRSGRGMTVDTATASVQRLIPRESAPHPKAGAPVASALLTPKEAQILAMLNDHQSNKLIARSLDVSSDTVKWHLKNLFSKLNAGSRNHAVERARMLGLLES